MLEKLCIKITILDSSEKKIKSCISKQIKEKQEINGKLIFRLHVGVPWMS